MRKLIYLLCFISFLISCSKENEKDPAIQTLTPTVTSAFSFTASGAIQNVGSYPITDYGFVYSVGYDNPDISYGSTVISLGKSPNTGYFHMEVAPIFSSNYYGNTIYYRAYITNSKGTVYGKVFPIDLSPLTVNSVSPMYGKVGDRITITGSGFSPVAAYNNVEFNGVPATVNTASATQITVTVPDGINSNYYSYNQSNITLYTETGTVYATNNFQLAPSVTGMYPTSGTFGTSVTITGTGFNSYNYYTIAIGNTTTSGYSNGYNSLTFTIPSDVNSEQLSVSLMYNNSVKQPVGTFTMNKPTITSFTPSSGGVGTYVSVFGQNFNNNYYNYYNTVKVGGVTANIYSSSSSQIAFWVPSLSPGTYSITVSNGITSASSTSTFTVQ